MRDMGTMLMQIGPGSHEIWIVLAGVAILASIFGNVGQWVALRKKREKTEIEQPVDVHMVSGFVTKDECARLHAANSDHVREVAKKLEEAHRILAMAEEKAGYSRKAIYTEIKDTNEQTRAHIEHVRQELGEQIAGMPDRIIAILRNFGVIGK